MNVLGPLARSVDDLILILKTIAGPDERDWETAPAPLEEPRPRPLGSFRFYWSRRFGSETPSRETADAIASLAKKLAAIGCKVEETQPGGLRFRRRLGNLGRDRHRRARGNAG